ncbi:MAG: hypothetical protein ABW022_03080 [Actinoplanes sp.]
MQPIEPPYLLTAVTDLLGGSVAVTGEPGMAVVEVAVHDRWSPELGDQVAAAMRMCLAGPPPRSSSTCVIWEIRTG